MEMKNQSSSASAAAAGQSIPNIIGNLESQDNSNVNGMVIDQTRNVIDDEEEMKIDPSMMQIQIFTTDITKHVTSKKQLHQILLVKGK